MSSLCIEERVQAERFPWSLLLILGYLELCMRVYVASESDPYGTGTSSSIGHSCPRVEIVRVPPLAGDFDLFGASQTSSPCCGEPSLTV